MSDDYWTTARFVDELNADPAFDHEFTADEIETLLTDLEAEGIVTYRPGHGWHLPSLRRAMVFLARNNAKLAAETGVNIMRDRLGGR